MPAIQEMQVTQRDKAAQARTLRQFTQKLLAIHWKITKGNFSEHFRENVLHLNGS